MSNLAAESLKWSTLTCNTVMTRKPNINPKMKWEYEDGVVLEGFYATYQLTQDKKYLDYIRHNMDLFIDEKGNISPYSLEEFNIDHVNNGKILIDLYLETQEPRYKAAIELLRQQLARHPRTTEGAFWHKSIYPYQIWLDGLYMGAAFYTKYAHYFNEPAIFDDALKQFILCEKHLRDAKTGLLYHAWDEKKIQLWCNPDTGLSSHFWGRSMGWLAMALIDSIEYFPEQHSGKQTLIEMYRRTMQALMAVRDQSTGLWYQILDLHDRPGNYLESSASAMIIYALQKGIHAGYLDPQWQNEIDKSYQNYIREFILQTREGLVNVNKMCHVAGLGGVDKRDGSYTYYISEPIVANDHKGVGAFILASTAIVKKQ